MSIYIAIIQFFIVCITAADISAAELPAWVQQSRPVNARPLAIPAFSSINKTLQKKGAVKLIVRLSPPAGLSGGFSVEGSLPSSDAVARQRKHISAGQNRIAALLSKKNAEKIKRYDFIPFMAVDVSMEEFNALAASPDIDYIQEDLPVPPTLSESVPLIGGVDGSFGGFAGNGQAVAILDTGVERLHPFLAGKVLAEACFSDPTRSATPLCTSGSTEPGAAAPCPSSVSSSCRHGTHVAGIAAGSGVRNGSPFSGVAKGADIIAVQVFTRVDNPDHKPETCGGAAWCILSYSSDRISAMEHVYSLRDRYSISSVNMSLGGGSYSTYCDDVYPAEKAAIDLLRSAGIATVIAAGNNSSTTTINAPACISSAVSVGATNKSDTLYSSSNMAAILNLLAPGVGIISSIPGDNPYEAISGTSMAAPHVAGAWAVLKSAKPTASVDEVLALLSSTGLSITDKRSGGVFSKPRIQLASAVNAVNPPPEAPSIQSKAADNLTATGARLNCSVNDNRADTAVSFDHGFDASYGTSIAASIGGDIPAGTGPASPSVTLAALSCNTTYHYRAKATNSIGTSFGSDMTFTTTACVPGAPSITSVAAGNSRAMVYFSPPASNGGSQIISYTVTPYTVTQSNGSSVTGDTVPIVITGLANGAPYTFTASATNAAGTGPASAESPVVIPGIALLDGAHETGYLLLQSAYEADSSGAGIRLLADTTVGGLSVEPSNAKGEVAIKGGFNDDFTDDNGPPSILGTVILSAGKTSFRNVIVRPP